MFEKIYESNEIHVYLNDIFKRRDCYLFVPNKITKKSDFQDNNNNKFVLKIIYLFLILCVFDIEHFITAISYHPP